MRNNRNTDRTLTDRGGIDLLTILHLIWSRFWLVLLAAIIAATLAGVLTGAFISPTYESGFTALVNNKADTGIQTSVTSADTSAVEILRSCPMLEAATKRMSFTNPTRNWTGRLSLKYKATRNS